MNHQSNIQRQLIIIVTLTNLHFQQCNLRSIGYRWNQSVKHQLLNHPSGLIIVSRKVTATLVAVNLMCNSAYQSNSCNMQIGFKIVISLSPWISLAVTSSRSLTSNSRFLTSRIKLQKAFLRFRIICVTSSVTHQQC